MSEAQIAALIFASPFVALAVIFAIGDYFVNIKSSDSFH